MAICLVGLLLFMAILSVVGSGGFTSADVAHVLEPFVSALLGVGMAIASGAIPLLAPLGTVALGCYIIFKGILK